MNLTETEIADLFEQHRIAGESIFAACESDFFPCDALALAALNRSLGLLKSFHLLSSNDCYSSAMALLRMQLDNILRLHGVILSNDAHACAYKIFEGKQLRDMKDRDGNKMTDGHLVRTIEKSIPLLPSAYKLCSSYIHLSNQHIHHFLMRSEPDNFGKREFLIGDSDEHVPEEAKQNLVKTFKTGTIGVIKLALAWSEVRDTHGTNEILKRTYSVITPQP